MLEPVENGAWVSLVDFAHMNQVSVSTLRRKIKKNSIRYKLEEGRYLIWNQGGSDQAPMLGVSERSHDSRNLEQRVEDLNGKLQQAKEEIAELKTLLALYEEKLPNSL